MKRENNREAFWLDLDEDLVSSVRRLSNEDAGKLADAMMAYAFEDVVPELEEPLAGVWLKVLPAMVFFD